MPAARRVAGHKWRKFRDMKSWEEAKACEYDASGSMR